MLYLPGFVKVNEAQICPVCFALEAAVVVGLLVVQRHLFSRAVGFGSGESSTVVRQHGMRVPWIWMVLGVFGGFWFFVGALPSSSSYPMHLLGVFYSALGVLWPQQGLRRQREYS